MREQGENEHKVDAEKLLELLRKGNTLYNEAINYLQERALKGNFSLADIGTSKEEVEQLRINASITIAKDWLDAIRKGTTQLSHDLATEYVRETARNANLSLADIGTSEEELSSLSHVPT